MHTKAKHRLGLIWTGVTLQATALLLGTGPLNAQEQPPADQGGPAAILITDKTDYAPGATAIITGTGFQPGEPVLVSVVKADQTSCTGPGQLPETLNADAEGKIVTLWHVCSQEECGLQDFAVNGYGQLSGLLAQANCEGDSHLKTPNKRNHNA